jgi:hypothetical protein
MKAKLRHFVTIRNIVTKPVVKASNGPPVVAVEPFPLQRVRATHSPCHQHGLPLALMAAGSRAGKLTRRRAVHQQREGQDEDEMARTAVADLAAQIEKACTALPPGLAVERLRNFCGRTWELLHTPAYAELEQQWLTEVPHRADVARFYAEHVYGTIHATLTGILERGIVAGELRPADARAAARVILSALVTQAFWCNHSAAFGPGVASNCHRAVADTLSLALGGLLPAAPNFTPQITGHS